MKYLLDVNVLVARLVGNHQDHHKVTDWLSANPEIVLCPLTELGFLRISTLPKFGFPMPAARQALETFVRQYKAGSVPADLPALESHPKTSGQVTDHYLADLAAKHGLRLATLDGQLKHSAAELLS